MGFGRVLEAERGRGIEEAIGQNADMQCAGEACEKRAQPRAVCDHRREWAELIGGRVHGLGNPGTGWTVERVPGAVLIEIGEDIVELAKGFGNWFRDRYDEAGLTKCSAHGLRKIGATLCAEKGATEHQLMAIFDWSTPQQAAIYTRAASRRILAAGSMHMLGPSSDGVH